MLLITFVDAQKHTTVVHLKAVHSIVRGDELWIYEPERKGQLVVRMFQREAKSTSLKKQIVVSFFKKTGHLVTVALENQKVVNSTWYMTICLPEVFVKLRETKSKRRILLHHDKDSSATSHATNKYLNTPKMEFIRLTAPI